MESQIEFLNGEFLKIYKLQNKYEAEKRGEDNLDFEMLEKYNKFNEYFYLEIRLKELIPKENKGTFKNNLFPNLSPQQIYYGYLQGDHNMIKYKDVFLYKNKNIDLFHMVTPNMTRKIWYYEKDLVIKRLLKVYCRMNIREMQLLLKNSFIPKICFSPSIYNINDPNDFVKAINDLDDKDKQIFNFIPFLRNYSKTETINPNAVYYLYDKLKLVNSNCFQ